MKTPATANEITDAYRTIVAQQKRIANLERAMVEMRAGLAWYRDQHRGQMKDQLAKDNARLRAREIELVNQINSIMISRAKPLDG